MDILTLILFGIIVLVTYFSGGMTGFGSGILALPLCTLIVGIKTAICALVVLGLLQSIYVVCISFRHILWKEYIRIVILVGLGLPFGMIVFSMFSEKLLRELLAIIVVIVSIKGLYSEYSQQAEKQAYNRRQGLSSLGNRMLDLILFLGGCVHGAYGTGGPLIIIYATQKIKDKRNFRATLCLMWVTVNMYLVIQYIRHGILTLGLSDKITQIVLFSMLFMLTGTILGNFAHERVSGRLFNKVVYFILVLSSVFLFL